MSLLTLSDITAIDRANARRPAGYIRSSFGENFSARMGAMLYADTGGAPALSGAAAAKDAYDWLAARTGREPADLGTEAATALTREALAARDPKSMQPPPIYDWQSPEVAQSALDRYLAANPDAAGEAPDIQARTYEISREAEARADAVSSTADTWGAVGGVVGDLVGGAIAPESLLTLPLAIPGRAAVGARAILGAAAREGALGVAVEAPVQALVVQPYRSDAGLDAGFWQGVTNVAVVGAGSAALGGLVRGVVEARNFVRARRDPLSAAGRHQFDTLDPAAQEALADSWNDLTAVENIVTREFETNKRFRDALTPEERAAIQLAIAERNVVNRFDVTTPAERAAVVDAVRAQKEALDTGTDITPADTAGLPPAKPPAPEVTETAKAVQAAELEDLSDELSSDQLAILREQVDAAIPVAPQSRPEPELPTLPKELAKAKPRYSYGKKSFTPEFASDVDRALFITAQKAASKRDADYRAWLREQGLNDEQINQFGKTLRDRLKSMARRTPEGQPLQVSRQTYADVVPPEVKQTRNERRKAPVETARKRKAPLPKRQAEQAAIAENDMAEIEKRPDKVIVQEAEDTLKRTAAESEPKAEQVPETPAPVLSSDPRLNAILSTAVPNARADVAQRLNLDDNDIRWSGADIDARNKVLAVIDEIEARAQRSDTDLTILGSITTISDAMRAAEAQRAKTKAAARAAADEQGKIARAVEAMDSAHAELLRLRRKHSFLRDTPLAVLNGRRADARALLDARGADDVEAKRAVRSVLADYQRQIDRVNAPVDTTAPNPAPAGVPAGKLLHAEPNQKVLKSILDENHADIVYQEGPFSVIRAADGQNYFYHYGADRGASKFFPVEASDDVRARLSKAVADDRATYADPATRTIVDEAVARGEYVIPLGEHDPRIVGFLAEMRRTLGLNVPIILVRQDGGYEALRALTGRHAKFRAAFLKMRRVEGFASSRQYMPDTAIISYTPQKTELRTLEVVSHELGHVLQYHLFDALPGATKSRIAEAHSRWAAGIEAGTAKDLIESKSASGMGRVLRARSGRMLDRPVPKIDNRAYWLSFDEWFADQVARWATTEEAPRTIVEQFFARLAHLLRRLYEGLGRTAGRPVPEMKAWLESLPPLKVEDNVTLPERPEPVDPTVVVDNTPTTMREMADEVDGMAEQARFIEECRRG